MNADPDDAIRLIQSGLDKLGHMPGAIDGRWGVRTARALRQLIAANGRAASVVPQGPLPWITEAKTALGRNEARDRSWLMDWLKRDGRSLGDPSKTPWCGDFVETAIKLAIPKEKVPANPYLARNWADWGEDATRRYGAVIVFWRGTKKGTQGHVGFATAIDEARGLVEVLGGNQGNEVSRAWLGMDRILAWRAPKGWASKMPLIGARSSGGAAISTNEA